MLYALDIYTSWIDNDILTSLIELHNCVIIDQGDSYYRVEGTPEDLECLYRDLDQAYKGMD